MGVKLTVPQREVVYFLPTKLTMLGTGGNDMRLQSVQHNNGLTAGASYVGASIVAIPAPRSSFTSRS